MFYLLDPTLSEKLKYQASKDLSQRSIMGIYVYLLGWIILAIPTKFFLSHPKLSLCFTLLFIVFSIIRTPLIVFFEKIYNYNRKLWSWLFASAIWLPALTWGIICAISISTPEYRDMFYLTIIVVSGIAGGGVIVILPSRVLTIGLVGCLLMPSILVLLSGIQHEPFLQLFFLIYMIGMIIVTSTPYQIYWSNMKHTEILEKLNKMDGLTELNNRCYFDDALARNFKQAQRLKCELTVILFDIDNFKKINDKHGHLVGDECLRKVAKTIKFCVKREMDTVARFGGEEFAVILPGTGREGGVRLAESIRANIEMLPPVHGKTPFHITISAGVATMIPAQGEHKETLINKADTALYQAKSEGKNRVVFNSL